MSNKPKDPGFFKRAFNAFASGMKASVEADEESREYMKTDGLSDPLSGGGHPATWKLQQKLQKTFEKKTNQFFKKNDD